MRCKLALVCSTLMLALLALPACIVEFDDWDFSWSDFRYRFGDEFHADLDGVERVTIVIVRGSVVVHVQDAAEIDIDVDERIKARDDEQAEELSREIGLAGHRSGTELRIDIDYGDFYHMRRYYACNLDVIMPDDVELSIETTHGAISLPRMLDDVYAETTHGSVELDACGGDADLRSTHGGIETGPVDGDLDISTTHGSIIVDGAAGNVRADTTHGDIEIELDTDHGFTISASTTHGRITDDLPRSFEADYNRKQTEMSGRYGDGRKRVVLSTTHGSIMIYGR